MFYIYPFIFETKVHKENLLENICVSKFSSLTILFIDSANNSDNKQGLVLVKCFSLAKSKLILFKMAVQFVNH